MTLEDYEKLNKPFNELFDLLFNENTFEISEETQFEIKDMLISTYNAVVDKVKAERVANYSAKALDYVTEGLAKVNPELAKNMKNS